MPNSRNPVDLRCLGRPWLPSQTSCQAHVMRLRRMRTTCSAYLASRSRWWGRQMARVATAYVAVCLNPCARQIRFHSRFALATASFNRFSVPGADPGLTRSCASSWFLRTSISCTTGYTARANWNMRHGWRSRTPETAFCKSPLATSCFEWHRSFDQIRFVGRGTCSPARARPLLAYPSTIKTVIRVLRVLGPHRRPPVRGRTGKAAESREVS